MSEFLSDLVKVFWFMKSYRFKLWVLSKKTKEKRDACCNIFSCLIWISPELYISCIYIFSPVPWHPRSIVFKIVPYLLYTVFSMYTLCKSRAFLQVI